MRNGVLRAIVGLLTMALVQGVAPTVLAQNCGCSISVGCDHCGQVWDGCNTCGKVKPARGCKRFGKRKGRSSCGACCVIESCCDGGCVPACAGESGCAAMSVVPAPGVEIEAPEGIPGAPVMPSEPSPADPDVPVDPPIPTEASRLFPRHYPLTNIAYDQPTGNTTTRGMEHFWAGRDQQAIADLSIEARRQPQDAVPLYYLALALRHDGQSERAARTLGEAVEMEQFYPVIQWGQRMQRIQGQERLWIETARR